MTVFQKILFRIEKKIRGLSLREVAKDAEDRIRTRTLLGYGVNGGERGGAREKLKGLDSGKTKKYIGRRKKARKDGALSSKTNPKKSNLTFTGQLLASLRGFVSGRKIIIQLKGKRDDGYTNADIGKFAADGGRPFFELTDKEIKGLRNNIKKDLIKSLRKR